MKFNIYIVSNDSLVWIGRNDLRFALVIVKRLAEKEINAVVKSQAAAGSQNNG